MDETTLIDPPTTPTVLTRTGARPTSASRFANLVPVINEEGRMARLDKWQLSVDPTYQRNFLSMQRVLRYAANWSWVKCGALLVSEREHTDHGPHYFVFDGQHRLEAAKRVERIKDLPCIIFPLGSAKDEAIGFLAVNADRKFPTLAEQYRALIMAGDPQAIALKEFADNAQRRITAPSSPTTISCVSDMMRAIQADEAALWRVWPLIIELCEGRPMVARIIRACHALERRMPWIERSLNDDDIRRRALRLGVADILPALKLHIMAEGNAGEKTVAMGLCAALNKGLRNHIRLDWDRRL